MSQRICFICHKHISNKISSPTCKSPRCQSKYMIQHDEWKKIQMDYLYGITYEIKEEDE